MEVEKNIVCFSGGKDSTYLLLWLLENGYRVDDIVYCQIMATPFISGDFPEMEDYLCKVENHIGRRITRVCGKDSFEDVFYRVKEKGDNVGSIYGFPYTIGAWCNSRLKVCVLDKYFCTVGPHIRYLGIAADEPKRYARLKPNCRAPLYEEGIKEEDCIRELKKRDLYNPMYDKFKRLGCWFCPKQSLDSLRVLYLEYPQYWQMLLKWDADSPVSFKPGMSVADLDKRFAYECRQTTTIHR